MDVVYRDACLTIADASGTSALNGLRGVSRPRYVQPRVELSGLAFVSSFPHPRLAIETSKWATRGCIPGSPIVFTNHQVYFQCYIMHNCESMDIPPKLLHDRDECFSSWNKPGVFPVRGIGSVDEIWDRIEEYSALQLSLPQDIINGMLGILHAFKEQDLNSSGCGWAVPQSRFGHVWGVPNNMSNRFNEGLFWYSQTPFKRREGFLRLSWTGWMAKVRRPYLINLSLSALRKKRWSASLELSNGRTVKAEVYRLRDASIPTLYLQIAGSTVSITPRYTCLDPNVIMESKTWWAQLHLWESLSLLVSFEWSKAVNGEAPPPCHEYFSERGCIPIHRVSSIF